MFQRAYPPIRRSGCGRSADNTVAEWNIYLDPRSARIVFESGAPITMIPLDATDHVPIDASFYNRIETDRQTPEADLVYEGLKVLRSRGASEVCYYFWDPLAAVVSIDETMVTMQTVEVVIVEEEGNESGWTKVDGSGNSVRMAREPVDRAAFENTFLAVLNECER